MFDTRFYCDHQGRCLVLDALNELSEQSQAKAYVRIGRLSELGNNLRRPECDYLRDGIYELRWRDFKVQYRLLYFFSGERLVVLSHIITKEKAVPSQEIDEAIKNKRFFEENPEKHSYMG